MQINDIFQKQNSEYVSVCLYHVYNNAYKWSKRAFFSPSVSWSVSCNTFWSSSVSFFELYNHRKERLELSCFLFFFFAMCIFQALGGQVTLGSNHAMTPKNNNYLAIETNYATKYILCSHEIDMYTN